MRMVFLVAVSCMLIGSINGMEETQKKQSIVHVPKYTRDFVEGYMVGAGSVLPFSPVIAPLLIHDRTRSDDSGDGEVLAQTGMWTWGLATALLINMFTLFPRFERKQTKHNELAFGVGVLVGFGSSIGVVAGEVSLINDNCNDDQ